MLRYLWFLFIITISSCSFIKYFDNYNINYKVNNELINDKNEVLPIEIKMPFFWMVRSWKEGKLVTLDGWGRYAQISFIGKKNVRLKHLVKFPRVQQDGWGFVAFPEAGLIVSNTGKMQHLAAIDDGKTKSHIPLLSWTYNEPNFILLDPDAGLASYQYDFNGNDGGLGKKLFIYNYKTDTMVYETPDSSASSPQDIINMQFRIDENYIWSNISTHKKEGGWKYDTVFYDWKKGEIKRNKLTEFLSQNNSYIYNNYIHLNRRYLFADVEKKEEENSYKLLKIDWDEDYSNLQVTDLDYLFKDFYKKKYAVSNIIISSDGSWVTAKVTDYSEYNPYDANNHFIKTRVFFHMDNKYLNGISMPVFSDNKETMESTNNDKGAFVQHPAYGVCYAQEWHSKGQIYLRLYKMDDVLMVINSGSQSLPFNYDNSKNYIYTREYSYEKELITGWAFEESDTAMETNQTIDSIIKYCETEMGKIPVSEPDNKLSKIELYKNIRSYTLIPDKNARVYLYINKSNEDDNVYYIEIDFYIFNPHRPFDRDDAFELHKLIICNQYFKYSESNNDAQPIFWEFYKLLAEGESAYKFFLNEMEKHRR
jgi:hypothetical protein